MKDAATDGPAQAEARAAVREIEAMQCGRCRLDFKRDPVEEIDAQLQSIRLAKWRASRSPEETP